MHWGASPGPERVVGILFDRVLAGETKMKSNEDKTLIIVKAKVLMEQNCIFWLLHPHQSSVFRESFV